MKTVVFACVHNAGRSQMAAALFNKLADPAKGRVRFASRNLLIGGNAGREGMRKGCGRDMIRLLPGFPGSALAFGTDHNECSLANTKAKGLSLLDLG